VPRMLPGEEVRGVDTTTPAVVLKLDHNVMHHGGLGVIRSLGRIGVPVFGVHEGRVAPAATSRYLHGRFIWRPDPAHADRLLAGLDLLSRRIGRPAVLIPTDDAGAIFLAEHGDALRPQFLFPRPPSHLPRLLAGKYSMFQMCDDLGIPCPLSVIPESQTAAMDFAAIAGFPLVAKLASPWTSGGLRSTSIIRDTQSLEEIYTDCSRASVGLMLQEFIPGGSGHDWFFHGYCDGNSACRPAFTGVKERSYPAHAGLTSLGRSTPNCRLRDQVVRLLAEISYRGIVDIDIRWDARDDQYKLLDFNPRLGAQFRLFNDSAGLDVVRAQYLDLTGQTLLDGQQVSERRYLVENYDPIAALSYWRAGELSLRSWVASVSGVSETAWFARDDLRPFVLMCLRMIWRLASRPLSRRHRPAGRSDPLYRPGRAAARGDTEHRPRALAEPSTQGAQMRPGEEEVRI